ncbi:MAG: hypothetical protein WBL23_04635 [Salinisphaera sp.]|uniref:hypothetical protein n=1 Tax=Salinisphaera sp. TaxID=1914330 RepID=UPI003C7D5D51
MDNKLKLNGFGTFDRTNETTDAVLVFRPSLPLQARWRFNPTMSIGGGDSDLTYELWAKFQFQIANNVAMRIGYRRLYYKIDNGNENKWDGSMHGIMLGLGAVW